jgi:cell division protein FtsB
MKNLKAGLVGAILVACAVFLFLQRQAQEKLRAQNESLQQQIAQLQTDNENLSNRHAPAIDSKSLSDEQFNELLKLRGEVGLLRQQTNQLGKLREENGRLHAQVTTAQNQPAELSQEDQNTLFHTHAITAAADILSAMRDFKTRNVLFPINMDLLQKAGYLDSVKLPPEFKIEDFEIVNSSWTNGDIIVLRQRVPYQNTNGKWVREYGLANGTVDSQYSDDGNFDAFEQQHSPPNQ